MRTSLNFSLFIFSIDKKRTKKIEACESLSKFYARLPKFSIKVILFKRQPEYCRE